MPDAPKLLRIPEHFHSVDDMLGAASKLSLQHAVLISETESGGLVLLDSGLTMAECNWLIDRLKTLMLAPSAFERLNV